MTDARITGVWQDDKYFTKPGNGIMLNVFLDNGESFYIGLDSKAGEPLFDDVICGRCGEPETNGKNVYWRNGAGLTLPEMMEMVQKGLGRLGAKRKPIDRP